MDPVEAKKLVDSWATNAIKAAGQTSLPPVGGPGVNPAMMTGAKPTFTDRNIRGVPLDIESGAPLEVRFKTALNSDQDSKQQYLEGLYGKGNVRFADTGEPIIRVVDSQTGGQKDLLINEKGFSLGDLAEAAANLPEVAGSIASMMATRRIPFLKGKTGWGSRGADVVSGTIGQETGTVLKEAIGTDKPIAQSLTEAVDRIPVDATFNALGELGIAATGRTLSPLIGERPIVSAEGMQAAKYFKGKMGEEFPVTVGQATGNPTLSRVEATMGKLPGASKEYEDIRTKQASKLSVIMRKIIGIPEATVLPGSEEIGERAIAALDSEVSPTKRSVSAALDAAVRASNQAVSDLLAAAAGPAKQLYPERVGQAIRTKAVELRDAFKGTASTLYDEAYKLPGGTDRALTAPSLPKQAEALIKELPPKDVVSEVPTGVLNQYGQEEVRTVTKRVPNKEFVPANVMGFLESLKSLKPNQPLSLRDLVTMRHEVGNEIAKGEAIPGYQTHYLTKIRDTLTSAIDEATSTMPNGDLKSAWEKANAFYREGVGQFHEGTIARLFKDIETRGFVQDEDIVRNIGPTEYATFKKFLGESSPEFQSLKRGILDQLFSTPPVVEPGGTLVDGKALLGQLAAFYKKNRAIADDILGPAGNQLQRIGELLSATTQKLDSNAIRDLLTQQTARGQSSQLTSQIKGMLNRQLELDKLYRSAILKDIGEGRLGPNFNASEFVDRFYGSASPKEIQQVTDILGRSDPEVLQQLKQKVIERLFTQAQRSVRVTDPSGLGKPGLFRPPTSTRLEEAIGKEDKQRGLQTLLGADTFNDLVNLARLVRPSEISEGTFKSAGGISAGMQITGMVREGVFSYLPDFLKQKIAAILLTRPALTKYVSGQFGFQKYVTPEMRAEAGRVLIASMPFIKAIIEDYGEEAAPEVLNRIQRGVQMFEMGQTNTPATTGESPMEKFKRLTSPTPAQAPAQ